MIVGHSFSQNNDSIANARMIETIEQSLQEYYKEYASQSNHDSIIDALKYEADDVPTFSDEEYCKRLEVMNEMSPFHLDCNKQTLSTIKFFVEKRRGFSRIVLGRSKLYFDLFEEKLAEYNMPIELKYLSVIESGLRPQVKSRAGALGLWQFMYRTGKMYGLKENSYIDERMDPEKATDAACRYLKKLYSMYNDWNLALAAYNAGPGNVNKAIRRSGNKRSYWEVRPFLPRETQQYVPNFIAAAYLLTHHAEHNIIPAEAKISYNELDSVCLKQAVHFSSIASVVDMDEEEIAKLNPIFKRNFVPNVEEYRCIRLPLTAVGKLIALEDSLYAIEKRKYHTPKPTPTPSTRPSSTANTSTTRPTSTSYQYHKVRSGETLGTIASKYRTSVRTLQNLNGLRNTRIYVGQRLKVKAGASSSSSSSSSETVAKKYYKVRSGDTFGRIAQRHGRSINQLKRLNPGININRLKIGQRIRVR